MLYTTLPFVFLAIYDHLAPAYNGGGIPVVSYIQYVDSDSTSDTDSYTYQTFPDAVCHITINGLKQTFKVSNADMGVVITSLKSVFDNMFDNIPMNDVIVTNQLIELTDVREDDITNTKKMENTFLGIFDTMLNTMLNTSHHQTMPRHWYNRGVCYL